MRPYWRSFALLFWIAMFLFLADPARAQTLSVSHPITDGDTLGHLDLKVGQKVPLTASRADSVKWSSGNTKVATVTTKGIVTAKARGYATITATRGTLKTTVRACVTATDQEVWPWTVNLLGVRLLHESRLRQFFRDSIVATFQVIPATNWGPCVHYTLDSASARFATIDRAGLLRSKQSVRGLLVASGPKARLILYK